MAEQSNTTPQRRTWGALRLKYTEPTEILRKLDVDEGVRVLVIGDGSNGAYEWAIERGLHVDEHSDVGYGCADIALRDGLIAYYGPSTSVRQESSLQRHIALAEAAHDLLLACDMEQHNEAIFKGKWKKGSKAWDGNFVRRMKLEAMDHLRKLVPSTTSPLSTPNAADSRVPWPFPTISKP